LPNSPLTSKRAARTRENRARSDRLASINSGLLLGVTSASKASGAQVLQWTDNGTADHLWTLTAS
jgi:hypothetical protein